MHEVARLWWTFIKFPVILKEPSAQNGNWATLLFSQPEVSEARKDSLWGCRRLPSWSCHAGSSPAVTLRLFTLLSPNHPADYGAREAAPNSQWLWVWDHFFYAGGLLSCAALQLQKLYWSLMLAVYNRSSQFPLTVIGYSLCPWDYLALWLWSALFSVPTSLATPLCIFTFKYIEKIAFRVLLILHIYEHVLEARIWCPHISPKPMNLEGSFKVPVLSQCPLLWDREKEIKRQVRRHCVINNS